MKLKNEYESNYGGRMKDNQNGKELFTVFLKNDILRLKIVRILIEFLLKFLMYFGWKLTVLSN